MMKFFGRSSGKLGTYSSSQLAQKLGLSTMSLNKIFKIESENYIRQRKKNNLKVTNEMKKYGGTPIFDGMIDKRNKFRPESGQYLAKKYGSEYGFNFDENR